MGAYLSTPVRDKITVQGSGRSFTYGAASMQGWRTSQEDAHNCCPRFDDSTGTALFAVYDGHGGAEVAQYMAANFPDYLRASKAYSDGNLDKALEEAFLGFDALLTKPEVIEQLQEIAGTRADDTDDEEMDAKEEAKMLFEEAYMPIEKLLAKYKAQKQASLAENEVIDDSEGTTAGANDDSDAKDAVKPKPNGADERLNGVILTSSSSNGADTQKSTLNDCDTSCVNGAGDSVTSNIAANVGNGGAGGDEEAGCSSSASSSTSRRDASSRRSKAASRQPAGDSADTADDVASTSLGEGCLTRRRLHAENAEEEESDSGEDSDDDEERDWQLGMDDGDDDEDEEEGEEEEEEEDDEPAEDSVLSDADEEPGAGSGCTAVVALLRNNRLIVANAGDSRCVLCCAGQAVEMSFDHKPESAIELNRIMKAGGCVTTDGRVNGGLNLSRAIGDHCYKRNTELPLCEQMISPQPDLQTRTLTDDDEFIVLACDGIWNMMSSQEVVSFVRERLQAGQTNPVAICEQMFDYCLAPDTTGDGTGCDNMTAIIILLRPPPSREDTPSSTTESGSSEVDIGNKRSLNSANECEVTSSSNSKRAKIDESDSTSEST